MRKSCITCLGIVIALVLVTGAGMFIYVTLLDSRLNSSSKQYVDTTVPIIVGTWDKDELLKRASPELKKNSTDEKLIALFADLKTKMGTLVKYDGSNGESNLAYTVQTGRYVLAAYKADATFEHGKAVIDIRLIQHGDEWQILGFYVDMQRAQGAQPSVTPAQ